MTLLNKASDGIHNVLIILIRSLSDQKKSKEDLFQSCKVGGMDEEKLIQTLNKWTKLGLFEVSETGEIKLKIQQRFSKSTNEIDIIIPALVREVIFREDNNKNNFWKNENNGSADLTRALAWLMAQDIYTAKLENNDLLNLSVTQFRNSGFDTITNSRDLPTLREYARFLGFSVGLNGLMIDPTTALKQDFKFAFKMGETLDAQSFMNKVSSLCPILDKGFYRKKIEEKLNTTAWKKVDNENKISSSLSFAIMRLSEMKILRLKKRDDSSSMFQPTGAKGKNWGDPFTEVEYIGESLL